MENIISVVVFLIKGPVITPHFLSVGNQQSKTPTEAEDYGRCIRADSSSK